MARTRQEQILEWLERVGAGSYQELAERQPGVSDDRADARDSLGYATRLDNTPK
jgi:hypothetical protein